LTFQKDYAGDKAKCTASVVSACQNALTLPGTGITPSWLDACSSSVETLACGRSKTSSACAPPKGTLANGAACQSDDQCQSIRCDFSSTSNADAGASALCGTCAAPDPTAGNCQTDTDCPGDQVCNVQFVNNKVTFQCVEPLAAGAVCSGTNAAPCGGTLLCLQPTSGTGSTCQPPIASGGDCAANRFACANGLTCDGGGHCVAPKIVQLGGTCDVSSVCSGGDCVNGTCTAFLALGAACTSNGTGPSCGPMASCKSGTCQSETESASACH
jgi:hypothetical protein